MIKTIKERFSDPFLGIFITSLIIWNWQIFLILLFDSQSMINRISFVKFYYLDKPTSFIETVFIPFLISLIWFIYFPKLKKLIIEYDETQKLKQIKLKIDINDSLELKPNTAQLEEYTQQFHAIKEEFYKSIFNDYQLLNREFRILKADGISPGQWLYIENNRINLAYTSKNSSVFANCVCIKILSENYILAQFKGEIPALFFNGFPNVRISTGSNLFLGQEKGSSSHIGYINGAKNQILGEWKEKEKKIFLMLSFQKH